MHFKRQDNLHRITIRIVGELYRDILEGTFNVWRRASVGRFDDNEHSIYRAVVDEGLTDNTLNDKKKGLTRV